MLFADHQVVIRGGGDLGTGVAYRMSRAGFPIVVLELAHPLAIRRPVSAASAVSEGRMAVDGLTVALVDSIEEALATSLTGEISVLISPTLPSGLGLPSIVVDARLAKTNLDTTLDDAGLVIGLGPGFSAGRDCHAVVETMRGHDLGRVLWQGGAAPNTGEPGAVGGRTVERVVRAPVGGTVRWNVAIADQVEAGDTLGWVEETPLVSAVSGVVRGLLPSGYRVERGMKLADVDPRSDPEACFTISDKALSVGGGAVEAALTWLGRRSR